MIRLRSVYLMVVDALAIIVAEYAAVLIRFEWHLRQPYARDTAALLAFTIPLRLVVYYLSGLYNRLWRYAGIEDLGAVIRAVSFGTLVDIVVIYARHYPGFPRSIILLSWLVGLALVGGSRLLVRLQWESRHHAPQASPYESLRRVFHFERVFRVGAERKGRRTLIVGAGAAGSMILRELAKRREFAHRVVGFIDDDPEKEGFLIHGIPVLGHRSVLPDVIRARQVNEVIIALPTASSSAIREVVSRCTPLGVELKTLPSIHELIDGKVNISQIRNVDIEDVLQRDSVRLDIDAISGYLTRETILVTGGGGSIGSELCRQIVRFKPKQLLILGHGENSIYEIDLELRRMDTKVDIVPIIGDVQDLNRIDQVFSNYRPGVVFHAAAHKHVPLMEANPEEAVKNNVFGTRNVAEVAHRHGSKRFVLISTDKAVNPANVMGGTKRVAELVIQELSRRSSTKFVAVRFGNVLGSRGSVIPLFKQQIAQGGPVTVTHPDMTRYFMTIPEAAQLVIQAGAMGQGGEIFLLDMGKPVRILDLAVDLIRLSGFEPYVDIPIEFVGMRPGEKLNEELLTSMETTMATKHDRIVVAKQHTDGTEGLPGWLAHLEEMAYAEASAAGQVEWQAQLASYRPR